MLLRYQYRQDKDRQTDPREWPGPLPGFISRIYGNIPKAMSFIEYLWLHLDDNSYE